jgi:hypothetical protein
VDDNYSLKSYTKLQAQDNSIKLLVVMKDFNVTKDVSKEFKKKGHPKGLTWAKKDQAAQTDVYRLICLEIQNPSRPG